ncbi:MAG TPA: sigma-54 dependent transcriptional regulator [Methylomirabilota bacterium]|jgi:DNA-binding NtrC family response regulator|nr:sigma-54 dependent transcriptional regulator [Methylomirabilota bacterium]
MAVEAPEPSPRIRPVVLVVDDDAGLRESFRLILEDDYDVLEAITGAQALETVRTTQLDLVLLDIRLPDIDGIAVLGEIKAFDEHVEVILVTAVQTVRTAVAAMKLGAFDYVTKPFDEDEILPLVRRAIEKRALDREVVYLRAELARQQDFEELVGRAPQMQRLYQLIESVARAPVTVLIVGESGTGKELIARAIHRQGPFRDGPFVPVNVAAIADGLLESELFGHEKGAFTGAFQKKLGKFELAHGGTLFLDEIASLRVDLQPKILRALQEREIERVGGTRRLKIDVRVVAATNADPKRAIQAGTLREDLYYRLNVVQIVVSPLRERREDVPLLVEHFVRKYNRQFHKQIAGVAPAALEILQRYWWPGNVRELQNIIERAVALGDGPVIEPRDLPLDLMLPDTRGSSQSGDDTPLKEARDQFERQLILQVLERVQWNRSEAARLLGMHRNSLKAKLEAWGFRGLPSDR